MTTSSLRFFPIKVGSVFALFTSTKQLVEPEIGKIKDEEVKKTNLKNN